MSAIINPTGKYYRTELQADSESGGQSVWWWTDLTTGIQLDDYVDPPINQQYFFANGVSTRLLNDQGGFSIALQQAAVDYNASQGGILKQLAPGIIGTALFFVGGYAYATYAEAALAASATGEAVVPATAGGLTAEQAASAVAIDQASLATGEAIGAAATSDATSAMASGLAIDEATAATAATLAPTISVAPLTTTLGADAMAAGLAIDEATAVTTSSLAPTAAISAATGEAASAATAAKVATAVGDTVTASKAVDALKALAATVTTTAAIVRAVKNPTYGTSGINPATGLPYTTNYVAPASGLAQYAVPGLLLLGVALFATKGK